MAQRKKSKRKSTKKKASGRKKSTKKAAKKTRARKTKSSRSRGVSGTLNVRTLANELMKGNFQKAVRQFQKGLEKEAQSQLNTIRKLVDSKVTDLKKQINRARKDVSTKILKAARKDLSKVQSKINSLAQRVDQLEKRIKNR